VQKGKLGASVSTRQAWLEIFERDILIAAGNIKQEKFYALFHSLLHRFSNKYKDKLYKFIKDKISEKSIMFYPRKHSIMKYIKSNLERIKTAYEHTKICKKSKERHSAMMRQRQTTLSNIVNDPQIQLLGTCVFQQSNNIFRCKHKERSFTLYIGIL
jgi:hypothetical protein